MKTIANVVLSYHNQWLCDNNVFMNYQVPGPYGKNLSSQKIKIMRSLFHILNKN